MSVQSQETVYVVEIAYRPAGGKNVGIYVLTSKAQFGPDFGMGGNTNPLGIWEKESAELRQAAARELGRLFADNQLAVFKTWQYQDHATGWIQEIFVAGKSCWRAKTNPNG